MGMSEPHERERAAFWEHVYVPINPTYEQDGTAPVNPVTVADHFMKAGSIASHLGSEGEALTEEVLDIEAAIEEEERIIARIRREIFSTFFEDMKASWSEEVRDAFVLSRANAEQKVELESAYKEIDDLRALLAGKTKRLETIRTRLKTQERIMEWNRQYTDYDKFQGRLNGARR